MSKLKVGTLLVIGVLIGLFALGGFTSGSVGDFKWKLDVDERIATLEKEIDNLTSQLSVSAVYTMSTLSSEEKFFNDEAEKLCAETKCSVATIYAIDYDTGKRKVIGMSPPAKRENMLAKEKRKWTEGYKVAEAVLGDVAISVVERLYGIDETAFNDIVLTRPYHIYNHSEILTDPEGMSNNFWDKTLGNQVTYTVGKLGIRPMVYIALDFNAQNADEAKQHMRDTMFHAPASAERVVNKITELNPALLKLAWLFR